MENYDPYSGGIMAAMGAFAFFYFIVFIVIIAGMWKVFTKAGKPGWAAIIPIYNIVILLEIVGKPAWWVILFLIPFVNFVIAILIMYQLALSFGQGIGMAILLIVLPFVGFPVLGFGSATYSGPAKSVV